MYSKNDIRQIIQDYHWLVRLIDSKVYECDSTSIGQYGIESAMPRAKGTTGDKVLVRVLRNEKDRKKTENMISRTSVIDNHEHLIENEKTYHILQLMKQGESNRRIKILLKIGHTNLTKRIEDIVNILYEAQDN